MRIPRHIYVGAPGTIVPAPAPAAGVAPAVPAQPTRRQQIFVGTEQGWLFGPAEGAWWRHFAWWVIPIIALLVAGGWYVAFVRYASASTPSPVSPAVRPAIIRPSTQPAPPQTPSEVTVEIPGLKEAVADLKSATEKLATAATPPPTIPAEITVNTPDLGRAADRLASSIESLAQQPPGPSTQQEAEAQQPQWRRFGDDPCADWAQDQAKYRRCRIWNQLP